MLRLLSFALLILAWQAGASYAGPRKLPGPLAVAQAMLHDWPLHVAPLIRRWVGHAEQYGRVG